MNKKIVISVVLTVCLLFGILPLSFSAEEETVNGIKYNYQPDGSAASVATENKVSGNIVIPEKVSIGGKDYTVTAIEDSAFDSCQNLLTVSIPSSLTSIGKRAFQNCIILSAITVDAANSSFASTDGILFTKNGDTLICYPADKEGETYEIPDTVKTVSISAFYVCKNLKSVKVPSSVKSVEENAFYGSGSLNGIIFEEGLEKIGNHAFSYCSLLTSLLLPSTVKSIGDFAFSNSAELKSLYFTGSKESWNKVEKGKYWNQNTQLGSDPAVKQITFKVVNGSWDDGTTTDKSITVIGNDAVLTEKVLPAVGKKPSGNCSAGEWNQDPLNTDLTDGMTFTYSYKTQCNVTSDPTDGGTVSGGGTFSEGESVTVTATPAEGYIFIGWENEDGYFVSTDLSYTFTLEKDRDLVASFVKTRVKFSTVDNSEIALSGAHLQILDSNGNVVAEWDSTSDPREIQGLKVGEEYTLRETAAPEGYTVAAGITFSFDKNGNVTTSGTLSGMILILLKHEKTSVKISVVDSTSGEEIEGATVRVIDSEGNVVDEWSSNKEAREIQGLKVGEEYTLRETAAPEGYTVSADATFNIDKVGKITATGSSSTDEEGNTVLLIENEKTSVGVIVKDSDGNPVEGAVIQIIDSKNKVVAEWTSASAAHTETALKTGETYTLHQVSASENYSAADDETFTISSDGKLTTDAAVESGVIVLTNEIETAKVTLTVSPTEGGAAAGGGTYAVNESVTVTATPGKDYDFVNWTLDGKEVCTDDSYTFTVETDCELVANFALKEFTVTVSAIPTDGGTAAGGGTFTVNDSVTVTATVNDLYVFEGWYSGDDKLSEDLEYTFDIKADIALTAKFREKTEYTVIWLNGDGKELDRKTYREGEDEPTTNKKPVKKEDANNYYNFVRWNKGSVEGNTKTYKPLFSILEKVDCTVIWLNGDGKVLDTKTYKMFSAEPKTTKKAVKAEDSDYRYVFRGWDKGTVSPGGTKKTYTPLFTAIPKTTYYVEWLNYDGTILDKKSYKEGQSEPKTSKIPTMPDDERYKYTFEKWSNGVTVGKTKTYSPLFKSTAKTVYTVDILDENGKITETLTFTEGKTEPKPKSTPEKAEDDKYTYVFDKWERTASGTKITYKPIFKAVAKPEPEPEKPAAKEYVIFWLNGDGTILEASTYKDGDEIPSTDKKPVKAEDEAFTYAFIAWTQSVNGDIITFTPVFTPYQKPIPNPETSDGGTVIILAVLLVVSLAVALILIFGKKRGEKDK